jgi:predicted metal-dependent hydrolase
MKRSAYFWITTIGRRREMEYTILPGDVPITVTRKRIKHLHLRVHAPDGRVTISAPLSVSRRLVEEFAHSRLQWINHQQRRLERQPRQMPREFVSGETHYLWGHPRQLIVLEHEGSDGMVPNDECITLFIRAGSDAVDRARVVEAWHKSVLHESLPPLIRNWEQRLNVRLKGYYLRRMKTRWGTCNYRTRHIRLNTELVTKPSHLLDYVVAHEMAHLIVPNHGKRFVALMNEHYPAWRAARAELNESRHANPTLP